MSDIGVLIDSDAFVGLMLERDAHHTRAAAIFDQLNARTVHAATTSLVVAETATVLSHASGQALARTFLEQVIDKAGFPVIFIDEALYTDAVDIFCSLEQRATSMTDCANVAVLRRFEIPTIFSFDKVYRSQFGISLAQELQ
jgi:predicted nucleic acid-binding protein